MAKRKTKIDYHSLARSCRFKWVGEMLPKNTQIKTLWECEKGHKWWARYNNIYNGNGCPYCVNCVKKTEKDYHLLANVNNFKWVGEILPKNINIKTMWKCDKKHIWETAYSNIYAGTGCPFCASKLKKIKDYHKLARNRGFKWCGCILPKHTKIKTVWQCKKGHKWLATYSHIQQGSGCPFCAIKIRRKREEDYHNIAIKNNFKWTGKELPENIFIKTLWKCKKGHIWYARYNDVQQGYGCPFCAGKIKKVIVDYYNLADRRGFKWIGNILPKNIKTKTWWECKNKHRWKATYGNIYSGRGCPYCDNRVNGAKVSKPQIKLNSLLYGSLNYPEAKYRIDVAIMRRSQKIAVEYDCKYWHSGREKRDAERDEFLISCGWKVLHVKSNNLLPNRKQMKQAINKLLKNKDTVNLYLSDWV